MGRFFVVLLATLFTVGMLCCIPAIRTTAFIVADHGVPWYLLIGGVVFYGYHRLSSKG